MCIDNDTTKDTPEGGCFTTHCVHGRPGGTHCPHCIMEGAQEELKEGYPKANPCSEQLTQEHIDRPPNFGRLTFDERLQAITERRGKAVFMYSSEGMSVDVSDADGDRWAGSGRTAASALWDALVHHPSYQDLVR